MSLAEHFSYVDNSNINGISCLSFIFENTKCRENVQRHNEWMIEVEYNRTSKNYQ